MNVTQISLEALILKATNETLPCPDPAALEAFCVVMRDSAEGPQLAAQALAARIHVPNAREALLGLSMLDRCMRRGDANFQAEVGKFRFLNEMIKLVSPKYFADRTAPEVRTRVLQLFHAWSIEYPKESKFKVAYEMLKNQGVIRETPPPLPPEDTAPRGRAKSVIFEDEEKSKLLQKLLQSKKPEDIQHANRLIKTMVKEEERRSEASSRRAAETGAALDSAELLRDMLAHAAHASADELQLIRELHASCLRLRPALQRLAASDTQGDSLEDILHASDVLEEVVKAYDAFVSGNKDATRVPVGTTVTSNGAGASLLDLAAGEGSRGVASAMDELDHIFTSSTIVEPLKPLNLNTQDDTDLLCEDRGGRTEGWQELDTLSEQLLRQSLPEHARRPDGFTSKSTKKIPMNALEKSSPQKEGRHANDALLDLDFFTKKPENCIVNGLSIPPTVSTVIVDENRPKRLQSAYCMWLASVKDKVKAENPQYTMNEVEKLCGETWRSMGASERSVWEQKYASGQEQSRRETLPTPAIPCTPQPRVDAANGSPVDTMLDISMPGDTAPVAGELNQLNTAAESTTEARPLSDIHVTVESVTPSVTPPVTLSADGLTLALHACRDRPRDDVSVLVVTTTNKRPGRIEDYKLSAVVPKPPLGCKVRLLPASATTLPPHNPFASEAITQVMLVSRPTPRASVPLKLAITFVCDDDMHSAVKELRLPAETLP